MNPTHKFRAAFVVVMLLAPAPSAWSQSKSGTTVGQFLLIEPSARIAAMGNAGATIADGLDAAYYNPAALGGLERKELAFSHSAWLAGIQHEWASYAMPLGRWGNGAATVTALNSGEIDVRTVGSPLGTGERYSVTNIALALAVGKQVTDRFSVGGGVTYAQETIWHSSMTTFVFQVGTLYQASERGLRIGASLSNFGTQGRFDGRDLRILYDNDPSRFGDNGALPGLRFTDAFALPVLFRVGLGYPVRFSKDSRLLLALDAHHPSDDAESVSAGIELGYRDFLALRGGFQHAFLPEAEGGLTAGAGLKGDLDAWEYRLDYAWADHGRLGTVQRVSFGVLF